MPQKTPGWTWMYPGGERKRTGVFRHAKISDELSWPPSAVQRSLVALVQKLYPQGHLPVEIALLIADRLSRGDVARLAAANHDFHECASDVLYHTVTLDLRGGRKAWTVAHSGCFRFLHLLSTLVTNEALAARVRRFTLHIGVEKTSKGKSLADSRRKMLNRAVFKHKFTEASAAILERLKLTDIPLTCVVAVNYVMIEQMTGLEYLELGAEDFLLRRDDTDDIVRRYLTQIPKTGRHPNLRTAVLTAVPLDREDFFEDMTWPREKPFGGFFNRDGSFYGYAPPPLPGL